MSVDLEPVPTGGTTVWVRPAFEADADPHTRVPGDPQLLTAAERQGVTRPTVPLR